MLKLISLDKHSSLFFRTTNDKEKKVLYDRHVGLDNQQLLWDKRGWGDFEFEGERKKISFEDTKRNLTSLSKASFNYRLHTDGENRLPTPSAGCRTAVGATKTKADSGSALSHSLRGNCFNYRFFSTSTPLSLSAPMLQNFLLRNWRFCLIS